MIKKPSYRGRVFSLCLMVLSVFVHPMDGVASAEVKEVSADDITSWVIKDHSLPIVAINITVKQAGFAYDPPIKAGLAAMAANLLTEGAGSYTSEQFKQALEERGINFHISVDEDLLSIRIKTLSQHLPEVSKLLSAVLHQPSFTKEAMERVKTSLVSQIRSRQEDPESLAYDRFRKLMFAGHPYGNEDIGTKESLQSITAQDLKAYMANHIAKDQLVVGIVGDVSKGDVKDLLASIGKGLPEHASNIVALPSETKLPKPGQVVERMTVPQSVAIFGHQGIVRQDKDFYAFYLLNYILGGGGFESRLTQEVREKEGLAYSVYTDLVTLMSQGVFQGYVATRNKELPVSLAILRREIRKIRDEGVSEQELADAKAYVTGSFPLKLDKNEILADYLISMQLFDLGKDFLEKRNSYYDRVTLEDVNRAARNYLHPDELVIMVVGNQPGQAIKSKQVVRSR